MKSIFCKQFRVVRLNEDTDAVEEVLEISDWYNDESEYIEDEYQSLLRWDTEFNFSDYENCPPIVFESREVLDGEWEFESDAVEDYMGL